MEDIPSDVYPIKLTRGTETTRNNIPDFTQEFDDINIKWRNQWFYLQTFFGIDQLVGLEYGLFVDLCGIQSVPLSENFYNIETGKGEARNC